MPEIPMPFPGDPMFHVDPMTVPPPSPGFLINVSHIVWFIDTMWSQEHGQEKMIIAGRATILHFKKIVPESLEMLNMAIADLKLCQALELATLLSEAEGLKFVATEKCKKYLGEDNADLLMELIEYGDVRIDQAIKDDEKLFGPAMEKLKKIKEIKDGVEKPSSEESSNKDDEKGDSKEPD